VRRKNQVEKGRKVENGKCDTSSTGRVRSLRVRSLRVRKGFRAMKLPAVMKSDKVG